MSVELRSTAALTGSVPPFWRTGTTIWDLSFEQLRRELASSEISPFHAQRLWRTVYSQYERVDQQVHDFVPPVQRWIDARQTRMPSYFVPPVSVAQVVESSDGLTRKLMLELRDGGRIETVIMGYPGRFTACLSTQVGCAMGCGFCATGQGGFSRHLEVGEIVAQVWEAQRQLRARGLTGLRNLVLMGMGEPLHNYDAVLAALRILTDTRGFSLGPSRITISTVGVIPGIRRLAEETEPFNLAVSLHAATQAERLWVVPVANRWPLDELMSACRDYCRRTGRRIFFEWTLIAGRNDSVALAGQVAGLLGGLPAHLNLIPLNLTLGFQGEAPPLLAAQAFQKVIRAAGIPCTLRQRRGIDVAAGCGQLAGAERRGSGELD